jgi:hypothetical protein
MTSNMALGLRLRPAGMLNLYRGIGIAWNLQTRRTTDDVHATVRWPSSVVVVEAGGGSWRCVSVELPDA